MQQVLLLRSCVSWAVMDLIEGACWRSNSGGPPALPPREGRNRRFPRLPLSFPFFNLLVADATGHRLQRTAMASSSLLHPPASKRRRKDQVDKSAAASPPGENTPLIVFAHGAGAGSSSEWMTRWKEMLQKGLHAVEVITFDYPYITGGKHKVPPKAEKLVDYHVTVVKEAAARYPGHPLILAGKSMGSRVSCMVAGAKDIHVDMIICLGYPLKGMNGTVRDETLLQLAVPTMFVQGSKDSLCPLDKLEATRKKMKATNELYVIDGGDHSFKIGKKLLESTGLNQAEAEERAIETIAMFVSKCTQG